jgi:hypothetical protein
MSASVSADIALIEFTFSLGIFRTITDHVELTALGKERCLIRLGLHVFFRFNMLYSGLRRPL